MEVASVDLDRGVALLALPREIGIHPDTNEMISAGIGRYGPYLKYADAYISIPADDTVITIGINHAVSLINESGKKIGRTLGSAGDEGDIKVKSGRFGPYVELGSIRATIPKSMDPDAITLEEAIKLIEAKKARGPGRTRAKKAAKSASGKEGTEEIIITSGILTHGK